MTEVDVIVPVHGTTPWLKECLDSIFNQSFQEFKIYLVIDRQCKNLSEVLEKFTNEEKTKINVLHSPGVGISSALNYAIEASSNEIIIRLDSDDCMLPNRIELQLKFMMQNPFIGLLGSQANLCDEKLKIISKTNMPLSHRTIVNSLNFTNSIIHPSVAIRREVLQESGLYCENADGFEDLELWLRLAKFTKFANLDIPLINYRIHPGQKTFGIGMKDVDHFIKAHRMNLRWQRSQVEYDTTKSINTFSLIDKYKLLTIKISREIICYAKITTKRALFFIKVTKLLILRPNLLLQIAKYVLMNKI